MQLRMRKSGCIALSILLVCSLFLGVTPVKAANEDVIVLSAGNVTLDLSVSTETIVVIDDGLTVNYADPLNMTVLIEVTGSGNVLDYDNTISAAVSGSFGATLGSLTFEGETDAATWQALLRSVTLSNESMEYLPLANEQRTITITALGVMDTKIVDVIAPGGDLSGGTGGDSSYTIDEITPTITEQPVDMTVNTGETASLSVTASVYAGELSYKWYRNITGNVNYPPDWQEVAGATNSTYTVPTELAGTTYYYVDVINTAGDQTVTIFSNFVLVTVNAVTNAEAPSITQQPSGTTVDEGESASLSVTATGTGTLSYQWYSNATNSNSGGTLIEGATSATYDAPTNTAGETYYYLVVTNTDDTATGNQTATETSNAVLVTVNEAAPEAPTNLSAAAGHGRVVLSWTGSANADSYLVYQGTAEGTYGAAVDAGSTGYTATGLTNGTTYYFAVKAVNAGGSSGYSNEASATPTSPPAPTYTITYDGNGNTGGSVPTDSNTYQQGKSVSVVDNTGNLAKTDYTFAGWNTQADGKGTTYAAGSTLTMGSANVTLYALWQTEAPIISTVAGTGIGAYSGDGGSAVEAQLKNPYGVAIDGSGNVYIADTSNNRIRKITTDGTISTIAGTGSAGYSGDGGPADKAKLNHPSGIAVDSSGNVYIADRHNNRIRKIASDGTISTVAGTGSAGYSGDGGPADKAKIKSPTGVTVDSSGNVYIADRYNNRIRKITTDGTISTVAGSGSQGYSGDGGSADKAQLYWPFGVAVDNSGNLYITDYSNNRARKVAPDGTTSTVAGTGVSGSSGDGGSAKEAQLRNPSGIAIDSSGNVYIAEYGNSRIRKIAPDGTITTVAGTGSGGYSGDGGPADKAKVNRPLGVAVDSSGNVYIADTFNHRIRKVTMSTLPQVVVDAKAPTIMKQPEDAAVNVGESASLSVTASVDSGTLSYQWYKSDTESNSGGTLINGATKSKYDVPTKDAGKTYYYVVVTNTDTTATGKQTATTTSSAVLMTVNSVPIITTLAGTGSRGYSGDGGPADKAQLNNPYGIAVDDSGNVYIADTKNNRVRKIATNGTISTIAGTGSSGYSGDGGPADKAQLNNPEGIAVDGNGIVYIADYSNHRIRKIAPDGTISTLAGNGSRGYSGDGGPAKNALLDYPFRVAVDSNGTVYIADSNNNRIRKVTPDGTISTVAGTGSGGYSGDRGPSTLAILNGPTGVAVDSSGNVYIVDKGNNRIRKIAPDGTISTIAGTSNYGYSGDEGPADEAKLNQPYGIAVDGSGNVYIADTFNYRIRKIAADGTISTIAGTGSKGYSGDGGPSTSAELNGPTGVAVDSSGNMYIADMLNNRIRKVTVNAQNDLGTVSNSNVNGQSTTTLVVNDQKLQDQINSTGKNGVITIQNNDSSDNFKAVLNGQSIQSMANKDQVLNVSTSTASISLPANLVNNGVSEQDASNSQVSVTIEEKPNTTVTNVTKGKSKLASKVVDFSITVTIGDSTTELNNFYSTYVSRSFDLTQSVNTKKSVGVVVNADGTLSPVPTEFVNVEGKQVAVLKRNGNSTYAVLENEVTLNDIAGHWGEDIIQLLADKLIVTGFGDGSFRPDQQVTRAEFVALIVRALGLVSTQTGIGSFTDVTSDDWYAGALAAAKEAGLVNGYADGSFRADQSITRQDASVLLGNAITFLQLQREQTQADAEQALSNYRDADQVSGYAQQAVGLASSLDILNGQGDGTFQPKANTTRAESATMIKKLMDLAGFISY